MKSESEDPKKGTKQEMFLSVHRSDLDLGTQHHFTAAEGFTQHILMVSFCSSNQKTTPDM